MQAQMRPVLQASLPEHYRRRMTSMQAALALKQLDGLEADNEQRIAHARLYRE